MPDEGELLSFNSRTEWRSWLEANHNQAIEARIVIYKNGPRKAFLSLHEAQEEALCFGWVDVKNKRIDSTRYSLLFNPRRAGSVWSISNIRRVERLIKAGLMTDAGLAKVAEARADGQWEAAIRIGQTDLIPPELEKALRKRKGALVGYRSLTHARKRQILRWLLTAKGQATRQRRIEAIVQESEAVEGSDMRTNQTAPRTIDEYIAGFPHEVQEILEKVRTTIRKAAPDAEETIKYQMPTFTLKGNLVHFAALKKHIGFYPTSSGIANFKDELSLYEGTEGSVKFPLDKPIPFGLISRIVKFRVKENLASAEAKGKKK